MSARQRVDPKRNTVWRWWRKPRIRRETRQTVVEREQKLVAGSDPSDWTGDVSQLLAKKNGPRLPRSEKRKEKKKLVNFPEVTTEDFQWLQS